MTAEKHPAYPEELKRCRYTLVYVEKTLEAAATKKERIDRELDKIKKHFNSDNSQNYIDLMINTTLQDSLLLKLRNLVAARSKPYFARVDFKEPGREAEKLYIGKMSLMREEDQEVVIIDWRAPVANLYYEGRLGNARYSCPDGYIEGKLLLKRQFSIENGILKELFDIDITANDAFLQSYLGANADGRLKEIVSTIQVEQNRIIRADMWTPLIVQGAAGSGKTTIALHRIAYLVYTHDKTFKPENFMIIAPTRFFLNYISEVLPELGVEKVRQSTFENFAMDLLGKKLRIKEANEKLARFARPSRTEEERREDGLLKKSSELKSSMSFRDMLDTYISEVESGFIPKEDFKINGRTIMSYEEINELFLLQYKMWPIAQRLNELKKNLASRLKARKETIINELHDMCDRRVRLLKSSLEESEQRRKRITEEFDSRDAAIGDIEGASKRAVKEYISRISRLSPMDHYLEFMSEEGFAGKYSHQGHNPELLEYTQRYTLSVLKAGHVDIEDLAPLIYLKYRIHGMEEKIPVKHIVIDEAQDFSVFQLYTLMKIIRDSSFTILGDLAQGIHSYRGVRSWEEVTGQVFPDRKSLLLTLEQSYRTTVEIMDAAGKVLDRLPAGAVKATPVIRHGAPVKITGAENKREAAEKISEAINRLGDDGFKSAAVICKTMEECREFHALLSRRHPGLYILTGKDDVYRGGTAIVPSYLSKGLEFDSVLIANASHASYSENELDIKLLYVAMTRALHRLHIFYVGEPSRLLD